MLPIVIGQSRRMASGSKRIGRGINMSWTGNAISLSVSLDASGGSATAARANQVRNTIVRIWNASFDQGYRVTCQVDMRFASANDLQDNRSHIYIETNPSASYTNDFPTLYYATMTLNLPAADFAWTPGHEFGHMLGLRDHYSESLRSSMHDLCNGSTWTQGVCGGARSADIEPGWEGNLMAVTGGALQRKNLEELFALHAMQFVLPGTSGDSTQEA